MCTLSMPFYNLGFFPGEFLPSLFVLVLYADTLLGIN
jgi:hypothetical protein